ncbi:MAG TPA: hypothetical protein VMR45_02025 [Patescibacteria group bacterium]|nr:hypothetical protein [Patescibacteria group bacterium]
MQPQSRQNKPVMDVAAPPKAAAAPLGPQRMEVAAAPISQNTSPTMSEQPTQTPLDGSDPSSATKQPAKPKTPKANSKPVALITVTIMVMIILSVLALVIYLTSQSS